MDHIGQIQGRLQGKRGPMYYWLTRFPWGIGTKDRPRSWPAAVFDLPLGRRRCAGHHQHASVCNRELPMAAHHTPHMQSLFVDAVQIARDLFQVNRDSPPPPPA
eukprot:6119953-Pyramimonas_sp.AAC.1